MRSGGAGPFCNSSTDNWVCGLCSASDQAPETAPQRLQLQHCLRAPVRAAPLTAQSAQSTASAARPFHSTLNSRVPSACRLRRLQGTVYQAPKAAKAAAAPASGRVARGPVGGGRGGAVALGPPATAPGATHGYTRSVAASNGHAPAVPSRAKSTANHESTVKPIPPVTAGSGAQAPTEVAAAGLHWCPRGRLECLG